MGAARRLAEARTRKPKKWIGRAIKHPGALTAQARSAGKSPMEFAAEHQHDSGTTGNRARLAMTLRRMHGG
jgi:hypothetical protein